MTTSGWDRRQWQLVIAMSGALSLVFVDQTAVSVALPTVRAELDLSTTELAWVVNAYMLPLAALVLATGGLGDLLGQRRLFMIGVVVFLAGSAGAGAAPSAEWLIAARAVQGAGAAVMLPSSTAILGDSFVAGSRGRALGLQLGVASVFLVLGPALGGAVTAGLGWRYVFWLNVALATAVGVLAAATVTASAGSRRERLDVAGIATSTVGLLAIVLAVMQGGSWGWDSPATLGLLALGLAVTGAFVVDELRSPAPLTDVRLLRDRRYLAAVIVAFALRFGIVGAILYAALYFREGLGLGELATGVALLPATALVAVVSPVGGWIGDRIGMRLPLTAGMAVFGAGLLWLGIFADDRSYALALPGLIAYGVGVGLANPASNTIAMDVSGAGRRGSASGVISLWRQLGGTVGVAVITAVVTSHAAEGGAMVGALGAGFATAGAIGLVAAIGAAALMPGRSKPS